MPYNFITVSAGLVLGELKSTRDIFDTRSIFSGREVFKKKSPQSHDFYCFWPVFLHILSAASSSAKNANAAEYSRNKAGTPKSGIAKTNYRRISLHAVYYVASV